MQKPRTYMRPGLYRRSIFSVMALLRFSRLENVATALRAWVEVAVGIGVLSLAGAIGFYAFVSAPKPAKHEHSMMCLAAYMAYRQVVGGPEEAALKRLKGCEDSRPGDEPHDHERDEKRRKKPGENPALAR